MHGSASVPRWRPSSGLAVFQVDQLASLAIHRCLDGFAGEQAVSRCRSEATAGQAHPPDVQRDPPASDVSVRRAMSLARAARIALPATATTLHRRGAVRPGIAFRGYTMNTRPGNGRCISFVHRLLCALMYGCVSRESTLRALEGRPPPSGDPRTGPGYTRLSSTLEMTCSRCLATTSALGVRRTTSRPVG